MTSGETGPAAVRAMHGVEQLAPLDRLDDLLTPVTTQLFGDDRVRAAVQGVWFGHGLHPLMTDFPLGMWMSGTLLDLIGGPESRPAAQRLIGLGVAAAVPTALTGLAEWAGIASRRERRTGALHAAVNSVALTGYAASWCARRRGHQGTGTALAIASGCLASVGGYLGGHLTEVRKVSSHHPAFDAD